MAECVFEKTTECSPCAGETGFDGLGRDGECFGERTNVETAKVFGFEERTLVGRELVERGVEREECTIVILVGARENFVRRIDVAALEKLPETATAAEAVVQCRTGDRAEPRGEHGVGIAGTDMAGDAQVCLLKRFGGEVMIAACECEEPAKNLWTVIAVKNGPRTIIAAFKREGEGT